MPSPLGRSAAVVPVTEDGSAVANSTGPGDTPEVPKDALLRAKAQSSWGTVGRAVRWNIFAKGLDEQHTLPGKATYRAVGADVIEMPEHMRRDVFYSRTTIWDHSADARVRLRAPQQKLSFTKPPYRIDPMHPYKQAWDLVLMVRAPSRWARGELGGRGGPCQRFRRSGRADGVATRRWGRGAMVGSAVRLGSATRGAPTARSERESNQPTNQPTIEPRIAQLDGPPTPTAAPDGPTDPHPPIHQPPVTTDPTDCCPGVFATAGHHYILGHHGALPHRLLGGGGGLG